jgi:hypothetical protein
MIALAAVLGGYVATAVVLYCLMRTRRPEAPRLVTALVVAAWPAAFFCSTRDVVRSMRNR